MNTYRVWYIDRHRNKDYDLVEARSREEAWARVHGHNQKIHNAWVDDVEIDGRKVGCWHESENRDLTCACTCRTRLPASAQAGEESRSRPWGASGRTSSRPQATLASRCLCAHGRA